MSPLTAAARRFRAAHHGPRPLVLPNVWDATSARVVAEAGFGALATSSGAVAETLGYADGQRTPTAEMFAAITRITRSVDVPVTADVEAGYGLAPGELAARLADAGVVGCNLEDSDPVTRELADPGRQADYLTAVHTAAGETLVINARVDVFVRPRPDGQGDPVEEAVERARRYLEAGADCCYPILAPLAALPGVVADIDGPVNAMCRPGGQVDGAEAGQVDGAEAGRVEDEGMVAEEAGYRLYQDLAAWWPLISPPEEYAEEAAFAGTLLRQAARPVREVLELGSGGGHCASHLTPGFTMTLVDLSPGMLAVSRRLNPGCEHVEADMRTARLGRDFDAVFIHDAVAYMTTEADLRLVIETAFAHCRPGGIAVFVPDHITENFEAGTGYGGIDGPDGRSARYLDWAYDPDPGDTWTLTQYAFLLRDADGEVRAVHETHRHGLFGRGTWLRLLRAAGFRAGAVTEQTTEDRQPREFFTAHRPPGRSADPTGMPDPAG